MNLPEHLFEYVSSITPLINVDLLIKNKKGEILLSWRDDKYAGTGWHIPGRIVRFQETLQDSIQKLIETEIHKKVKITNNFPIDINEIIFPKFTIRGHFISFLFLGITEDFKIEKKEKYKIGDLQWFSKCPENFLDVQNFYKRWMING